MYYIIYTYVLYIIHICYIYYYIYVIHIIYANIYAIMKTMCLPVITKWHCGSSCTRAHDVGFLLSLLRTLWFIGTSRL